jgi:hypothetical protein
LRFVDDEYDASARGMGLHEMRVQSVDLRLDRALFGRCAVQLVDDRLQELDGGELRRQDQCDVGLLGQLLQQAPDECRLARPDLARQLDEAAALGDPVEKMRERVRVPRAHVEITRIRGDRERLLVESEEVGIHVAALSAG